MNNKKKVIVKLIWKEQAFKNYVFQEQQKNIINLLNKAHNKSTVNIPDFRQLMTDLLYHNPGLNLVALRFSVSYVMC